MSDSSDIDAAVSATLLADATLMSYAPDGVYFDEGAPTAKHFIVCSLVTEFDAPVFNARSHEDVVYRVKVIDLNVSGLNAKRAAARIDALLDGAQLTIAGYTLMMVERTESIRYVEIDSTDQSLRWQHRGGLYRLMASL